MVNKTSGVGSSHRNVLPATALPRAARTMRWRRTAGTLLTNALGLLVGAMFVLPFYWMVSSSLKPAGQMFQMPPVWWPHPFMWSTYARLFTDSPFGRWAINTFSIAAPVAVGTVLSCTMAAYGFSRIPWRGRDLLFAISLATLMVPFAVTMVPQFIMFRTLGWVGSYSPLIVPAFFGNAYSIFLLRQFFRSVPLELSDAARVDGAMEWSIFWRVVLPLVRPALAVVALFSFIGAWGDFLGPLIYINDGSMYTIALGLYTFLGDRVHDSDWGLLMAASTLSLLPIVIIFFLAQRTFIEGIKMTGLKG
jgi:multiple sugar transport system permease protein